MDKNWATSLSVVLSSAALGGLAYWAIGSITPALVVFFGTLQSAYFLEMRRALKKRP